MTADQWIQLGLLIIEIITAIIAIIAIKQTHDANKKSEEAQEFAKLSQQKADEAKRIADEIEAEMRRRQEDYVASEQYGKVKELIRPFEKSTSKFGVLLNDEQATLREKQMALMDAYNEYTDLFNEINSFCALVNNGSIVAENYMKNTAISILKKKAVTQAEYQLVLMQAAKELKMPNIRKPDYRAFSEYNHFLDKRTSGMEKDKIIAKRREAGIWDLS